MGEIARKVTEVSIAMTPTVTAVVTCMTDAERPYLLETLESVSGQTFPCNILLVVQQSNQWVTEIVDRFPSLQLLRLPPSLAGAARNAAVNASDTEYIAFLDGDDIWCPDKIERQVEFLEKHRADFVAVDHLLMSESGRIFAFAPAKHLPMPSSWMVRRSVMLQYPFDPSISTGVEDGDWWVKTYHLVVKKRLPEPLIHYRVRITSLSSASPSKRRKVAFARMANVPVLRTLIYALTYLAYKQAVKPYYVPDKSWNIGSAA